MGIYGKITVLKLFNFDAHFKWEKGEKLVHTAV
jgi:hypothetical protein